MLCRRAARGGRKDYKDKVASESEGGDSDEEEEFKAEEFEVCVCVCVACFRACPLWRRGD